MTGLAVGAPNDFDNDNITDFVVYDADGTFGRPAGSWYVQMSTAGAFYFRFGYEGTIPITGDFDGDGTLDYGCYDAQGRAGQPPGSWFVNMSSAGAVHVQFGYAGTAPIVGDFDGDSVDDYGCYDPHGQYGFDPGTWHFLRSSAGYLRSTFGYGTTLPVVGDIDGDGLDDYGCYDPHGAYGTADPGTWFWVRSKLGATVDDFVGSSSCYPVIGDFNGDDIDDYGAYNPASGLWTITDGAPTNQHVWAQPRATFGYEGTVVPGPMAYSAYRYRLLNRRSGLAMDVWKVNPATGASVVQYPFWNGDNQLFRIVPAPAFLYVKLVASHSGKCIDVAGISTSRGARIIQWPYYGGVNQMFQFRPADYGYWRLVAYHSGKCVDVAGAGTDWAVPLIQWDSYGGYSQQWRVELWSPN